MLVSFGWHLPRYFGSGEHATRKSETSSRRFSMSRFQKWVVAILVFGGILIYRETRPDPPPPPPTVYIAILRYDRYAHYDPFAPVTEEDLAHDEFYAVVFDSYSALNERYPGYEPITDPPYIADAENWLHEVTKYGWFQISEYQWQPAAGRENVDMMTALMEGGPYVYFLDETRHLLVTPQGDTLTFNYD